MRTVLRPLCVVLSWILAAGSITQAQSVPAGSSGVQELQIRVLEGDQVQANTGKTATQGLTVVVVDGAGKPVPAATVLFRLPADPPTGVFSDGSRVALTYTDMDGKASVRDIHWGRENGSAAMRITASRDSAHAGLLVEQVIGQSGKATTVAAADVKPPEPMAAEAIPQTKQVGVPQQPSERAGMIAAGSTTLPTAHSATPAIATAGEQPSVLITSNPSHQVVGSNEGHSSRKWLWIGLGGAAAAGLAFAFMGQKSSTSSASQPSLSIGTPTVSIGHP